jgi:tetratricopeptide (TPR) repeat protein
VAAALESIHQDRLDEVAGLIAQHYAEGDRPEQAAKYARLAGQRAERLAAWKAAIGFFRQALAASPAAEQAELLVALGNAQLHAGELAAAEETLRQALQLPPAQEQVELLRAVLHDLGESLILQARYAAVMELAQSYANHPDATIRGAAQFMWGASLSLEGLDLDEAARHLAMSLDELKDASISASELQVAHVEFELGNIAAQQGRLAEAIAHYQQTLALSRPNKRSEQENDDALRTHILAHNNIAYHLHLMGDPRAGTYLEQAIAMARDKGMLTVFAFLLSTQGEIALAQEDFAGAEIAFTHALAHAQRLNQPERVAGITANLGRLAQARGQSELAIHRLSTALSQADTVSSRFLAAQIRLWLAPLLPPATARPCLAEARDIITAGHYHRLLPQLERLEAELAAR